MSLAGTQCSVRVAEKNSEQFAARLRKVAKERAKWARRAGVTCYRVYDADLPDYALSVDVFESTDGPLFARLEEHPAPASIDENRADRRFADAAALVPAVLDIDRANVVTKRRNADEASESDRFVIRVAESDLAFEVNVAARQDTGLALDLRPVRQLIREMADGARFLSLGSYAGVPAACAAAGGARETTVVDTSSSYLDWARRNLEANGFSGKRHHLERTLRDNTAFDLVYCDSSALGGTTVADLAAHLSPSGAIILTSRQRDFRIDDAELAAADLTLEDVTAKTIPHDFSRTPKVHRCLLLRHA